MSTPQIFFRNEADRQALRRKVSASSRVRASTCVAGIGPDLWRFSTCPNPAATGRQQAVDVVEDGDEGAERLVGGHRGRVPLAAGASSVITCT